MRSRFAPSTLLAAILLLAIGCAKDHDLGPLGNPRDPGAGGLVPPVPVDLQAEAGNRSLTLSWSIPDSSIAGRVRSYRIYHRADVSEAALLADSASSSPVHLEGLGNEASLLISVSSVLTNGLEGHRSREIVATPGLYSITMEEGQARTRSRPVRIALEAPGGTVAVTLSGSPDLRDGVTFNFASSVSWTLEEGDGSKTVYARFTDFSGNASEIVSDSIELDTRAEIVAFLYEGSQNRAPGDKIVFRLDAGEPGGIAEVEIPAGGERWILRDDGVPPDDEGQDGAYAFEYLAFVTVQFTEEEVIGRFQDEAGNEAVPRPAPQRLTIHASPEAVVLDAPFRITEKSLALSWSRNLGEYFAFYRILRGERAGVLTDPSRRILTEIRDRATLTYEDRIEIEEGRTYFYIVEVVDGLGAGSASNEVSATTDDLLPTASTLSSPDPEGETSASLSWTKNQDRDFDSYMLFRSDTAGVDQADSMIAEVQEAERTRWLDGGLRENTEYYYRLYVKDRGSKVSASNELRILTANTDPPAVSLYAPVEVSGAARPTVDLSWSASEVHDFDSYRLYRDTSPAVGQSATLVRTIDTPATTNYQDAGLADNTRYYYRAFVRDGAGASTGSEERSIVTANRAPTPVTLSLTTTTTSSLSLSWTRNNDPDFLEYRLLRGTSPAAITLTVATFDRAAQTTYTDFVPGQDPEEELFYKIVTYDSDIDDGSSLHSDSNIVSGTVSN